MNYLNINFKARYYDNGVNPESTEQLWFVLHGYGQLAQYFIKKFDLLKTNNIRVIAPEGLHRYYLKESKGRVGASWMTKEDRLVDIENYLTYLNEVYKSELLKFKNEPKLTVLGFSQGAATACRWVSNNVADFNNLILWAGLFPPDLNFQMSKNILYEKKIAFVYGTHDEYVSDERFTELHTLAEKLDVKPKIFSFEGNHSIQEEPLLDLLKYTKLA